MKHLRTRLLLVRGLSATATLMTTAFGAAIVATPADASTNATLADVRAATAAFHDPAAAIAAGYQPTDDCVAAPGLGVMGQHWVTPANLLGDASALDPLRPQALLYVPGDDGLQLVAVEYIVFAPDQEPVSDTNIDPDGPQLFGEHFQGPMAGHSEGMPTHYDLHVSVWRHNPSGTFAPFNPAPSLHC